MGAHRWVGFDCDGVLLDNELDSCRQDSSVLKQLGVSLAPEVIIRRFAGCSVEQMLTTISGEVNFAIDPCAFKELKSELKGQAPRVFPGVWDCLSQIQQYRIPYCVVSSTEIRQLEENLDLCGLKDAFANRIFSASMVANSKPAPDVYLLAANSSCLDPQLGIAIEDSANGVVAARSAGMRVAGFIGGSHCLPGHEETLRDAGAEWIFGAWNDLAGFLIAEVS